MVIKNLVEALHRVLFGKKLAILIKERFHESNSQ